MQTSSLHRLVRLGAGELLSLDATPGLCVVVFDGHVWITQHDDPDDHVVGPGQSFTCDRAGLTLVEALRPTRLAVLAETAPVHDAIGYEAAWPVDEAKPAMPAKARSARTDALAPVS
jgi:hypothetical protein